MAHFTGAAGFEPAIISDGESLRGFEPHRARLLEIKALSIAVTESVFGSAKQERFSNTLRDPLAHGSEQNTRVNRTCAHILPNEKAIITEKRLRKRFNKNKESL